MISPDEAVALAQRFTTAGADEAALAALRAEHPDLRFATCSEDDVPPRLQAWTSAPGVQIYLLDATEHCMRLSRDPETACGIVFALEVEE